MSDQGQWQVAGDAAEVYERALVPAIFAPWAPLVVALADPRPGERVLDVACGTGVLADSLRNAWVELGMIRRPRPESRHARRRRPQCRRPSPPARP